MALTASDYKSLIVTEVGDTTDGLINLEIETLWELYAATTDLMLRYFQTKRKAIDLLMGKVREQISFSGNNAGNQVTVELSDKLDHLQTMWKNVSSEISDREQVLSDRVTAGQQTLRQPVVGQLHQTAPVMGRSGYPDPNDRRYRGDPLRGR